MARRSRKNNAIREALIAYRTRFEARWPTSGAQARLAAAEAGAELDTNSDELLTALLPVNPAWAHRFVEHPTRRYRLTRADVLLLVED